MGSYETRDASMEQRISKPKELPIDTPATGQAERETPVVRVRKRGGSREALAVPAARTTDRVVTVRKPGREVAPAAAKTVPAETKSDGFADGLEFGEYHRFLEGLEEIRPDNMSHVSTELYLSDLNLDQEFATVPAGGLIVDVGCCGGVGTEGLAEQYPDKYIVGVTPNLIPRRASEPRVPILQGRAEELTDVLRSNGLGQADMLLARNVLELMCMGEKTCNAPGLLPIALRQAHDALVPGGSLLIYDQLGTGQRGPDFYETYTELGEHIGFAVARLPSTPSRQRNGQASEYLRMTKPA